MEDLGKMSGYDPLRTGAGAPGHCAPCRCAPDRDDPVEPANPDLDEEEHDDLELDDPTIDEAALPDLDTEDAELPLRESGYDDLLDRGWLERAAEEEWDDERSPVDEIGLTIELDSPAGDDDGAQVVDLDVGSLLTSLPSEGTELDLEPGPAQERGELGVGVLHDMLLPEDEDEQDDREVGDDSRFPVFDDDGRPARPHADDESEIGPDDLS